MKHRVACQQLRTTNEGTFVEGVGWETTETYVCAMSLEYCIFNTEDWDSGTYLCPVLRQPIEVTHNGSESDPHS